MSPVDRLRRLHALGIDAASSREVASALRDITSRRGWSAAKEAERARRQHELAEAEGAAPAVDALHRGGRRSRRDAQRTAERAAALADAPAMTSLLEAGRVSTEHADVLASELGKLEATERATLLDDERSVAMTAAGLSPERFRRDLQRTIREQRDDDGLERSEQQRDEAQITLRLDEASGMGEIRGQLHPDDYQRMQRRVDAEVRALQQLPAHRNRTRAQVAATALVNLVCGARSTARPRPELSITVGLAELTGADRAARFGEYADGSPVPVETIRRHACEADIIPVVLGGDSMPLDVGRARRLATRAQRHALRSMYRTCAVGDCAASFERCEVHHTLEWSAHHGETDLAHLVPLCSYHHHRVHEGRWQLDLDTASRQLTVRYPDGTIQSTSVPDLLAERRSNDHRVA